MTEIVLARKSADQCANFKYTTKWSQNVEQSYTHSEFLFVIFS